MVAKVQFDIKTYRYVPLENEKPNKDKALTFNTILLNSEHDQLAWKKDNLVYSIAIGILSSSLFLLGASAVIGGFLKATFTFSATPLIWCPIGIVVMGLTIATVWKSRWICNGIETYFLPHVLKSLLNYKIEKSRNFIGLYSLFAGTNDPKLTRTPYLKELQAIISLNLTLSTLTKACETEDTNSKEKLINNSQQLAKNIDTNHHFFDENHKVKRLIEIIETQPSKITSVLTRINENAQFNDLVNKVV